MYFSNNVSFLFRSFMELISSFSFDSKWYITVISQPILSQTPLKIKKREERILSSLPRQASGGTARIGGSIAWALGRQAVAPLVLAMAPPESPFITRGVRADGDTTPNPWETVLNSPTTSLNLHSSIRSLGERFLLVQALHLPRDSQ